ncbi:hypothetical protein [Paraburkholderia haematera]|uniref:hypothetical protein n=1 Tax=Paraburkholderia haematera TaxID=2793077 RepID=UPI001B8B07B4|nr:hypothetical protein [Paraburkholderia haematera]
MSNTLESVARRVFERRKPWGTGNNQGNNAGSSAGKARNHGLQRDPAQKTNSFIK